MGSDQVSAWSPHNFDGGSKDRWTKSLLLKYFLYFFCWTIYSFLIMMGGDHAGADFDRSSSQQQQPYSNRPLLVAVF